MREIVSESRRDTQWGLTQHCTFYLSWPTATVVSSKPSHGSSLGLHCFSFCLWWDDTLCGGGKSFITVYLLHAWTILKLCVGQTPGEGGRWGYCQQCEQHQYRLPLHGQVPHHYLGDLLTRIPHVWAVKSLLRLPIGRYIYPQHIECIQM